MLVTYFSQPFHYMSCGPFGKKKSNVLLKEFSIHVLGGISKFMKLSLNFGASLVNYLWTWGVSSFLQNTLENFVLHQLW